MSKFGEVITSETLVLVDFYAAWSEPCKMVGPILDEVSSRSDHPLKIVKIDVDKNYSLAKILNVRSVPTIMLYREGTRVWRQTGVVPADQLIKLVYHYSMAPGP